MKAGDSSAVDRGGRSISESGVNVGNDSGALPGPDSFAVASGGGGGRGAVRLIQTVAAVQTPYRYAAVLHFWDVVREELPTEIRRKGAV